MKRMAVPIIWTRSVAAFVSAATACGSHRNHRRELCPSRELVALRISPRHRDFTIDQDQRQSLCAGALQKCFYDGIFRIRHRLLREVETLDRRTIVFCPRKVGGKIHQLLIDIHTAHAGTAAEGGIEDLNGWHDDFSYGVGSLPIIAAQRLHISFLQVRRLGNENRNDSA